MIDPERPPKPRPRRPSKDQPVGVRVEEDPVLYQPCPQCSGNPDVTCVCERGFVQTGWVLSRCDRMVKENDEMLVLLADLRRLLDGVPPSNQGLLIGFKIDQALRGRETEIADARTRTTSE